MRFRLTPRETSFYDMFAASADNIVTGSKLLMELGRGGGGGPGRWKGGGGAGGGFGAGAGGRGG